MSCDWEGDGWEIGGWFVDRITFDLGDARTVTDFTGPQPVEKALAPGLAEAMRRYLPAAPDARVHVDPRAVIETSRLVLGGIRVIAHPLSHGVQPVTMCFDRALGSLQAMLAPRHRSDSNAAVSLERSAADALLNLMRPCLDLACVDPTLVEGEAISRQVSERLDMLAEKKDDLAFFVYLLKRYVENASARDDGEVFTSDLRGSGQPSAIPAANRPAQRQRQV